MWERDGLPRSLIMFSIDRAELTAMIHIDALHGFIVGRE